MNGRLHRKLIDAIVESICNCVAERDNQVQLQIIKALLTIVTTYNFKVHEKSLLEAFRACYQIHISKYIFVFLPYSEHESNQLEHGQGLSDSDDKHSVLKDGSFLG